MVEGRSLGASFYVSLDCGGGIVLLGLFFDIQLSLIYIM